MLPKDILNTLPDLTSLISTPNQTILTFFSLFLVMFSCISTNHYWTRLLEPTTESAARTNCRNHPVTSFSTHIYIYIYDFYIHYIPIII